MARTKGNLSNSEPKNQIIKFILKYNGPVEESKIREELKKKNKKTDQGNVNRYLHELRKESACIELETIKKGQRKYNLWNITKIENLKNIMSLFPEIQLNKYEKSVDIVLKKFNFATGSRHDKAFVHLSLSASFFKECVNTDIETLCARASKLPQLDRCFISEREIEKNMKRLTQEVYLECMVRIQKIPGMWPIANEEYIEDSVNFGVYQNTPQSFQNSAISEVKFKRILEGMKLSPEENDSYKETQRIIKELSVKMSHEILSKRLKELPRESLQNQEISNKMSDEIFEKLMEEFPENLPNKICKILVYQFQRTSIIFDKIFDHFYQRDIMDGIENQEEQRFISKMGEAILSADIFNKMGEAQAIIDKFDLDFLKSYEEKWKELIDKEIAEIHSKRT